MWKIQRLLYPFFDLDGKIPIEVNDIVIEKNGSSETIESNQLLIKDSKFYKGNRYYDGSHPVLYDLGCDKYDVSSGTENMIYTPKITLNIKDKPVNTSQSTALGILKLKDCSGAGLSIVCIQHSINCLKYSNNLLESFSVNDYKILTQAVLNQLQDDDLRDERVSITQINKNNPPTFYTSKRKADDDDDDDDDKYSIKNNIKGNIKKTKWE